MRRPGSFYLEGFAILTIDDAIRELEDLRRIYGGHVALMLEDQFENIEPLRFDFKSSWTRRYVAVRGLNSDKNSTSSPLRRR